MINIKQAVAAAEQHLKDLYGNPPSVQLEEIYLSDDESSWLVTLSFLAPIADDERSVSLLNSYATALSEIAKELGKRLVRKYKTFEVDRNSGEVRSMKIRPVPSV